MLTKGTAYIYLPFLMLACWWMGAPPNRKRLLLRVPVLLALIVALNAAQYVRCYRLTGTPLGLPLPVDYPRTDFAIGDMGVRTTLANILRNASLHLATPSKAVNSKIEAAVRGAIRSFGGNPDDPQAIWLGERFMMNHFSSHEVYAGNPVHLAALLLSIALVCYRRRQDGVSRVFWYALGLTFAFVAFSSVIRWQIWSSRYHLPLFVAGSALIGFVLEKYCSPRFAAAVAAVFLVAGLPFAVLNHTRALLPWSQVTSVYHPRAQLYFSDQHEPDAELTIQAAGFIDRTGCADVAIDSYLKDPAIKHSPRSLYLYPLLALMHADGTTRRVWYSGVQNLTARYYDPAKAAAPCAVVCLDCGPVQQKWDEYRAVGGRASVFDNIAIFTAAGALENNSAAYLRFTASN